MGYYTRYDLTVKTRRDKPVPPDIAEDLIAQLRVECGEADYALDGSGASSGEGSKWYNHEVDMGIFSTSHPDFLFVLHGHGEGRRGPEPDIWNKYFLGGKMQSEKAKMQIGPFDPTKLE